MGPNAGVLASKCVERSVIGAQLHSVMLSGRPTSLFVHRLACEADYRCCVGFGPSTRWAIGCIARQRMQMMMLC